MAQNSVPKLSTSSLVLVLALAIIFLAQAKELTETQMSLYLQDIAAGPNATLTPIAGIAGKLWTFTQFGTVYVTDDPITETPDPNSALIGRLQGIYVASGLQGRNTYASVSIVFTSKEYNGSTLELQGNSQQFEQVREISVVSGTGKFRFARGYATFETYFLDQPNAYSILRCNVTVLH
ncbi:Disease resistance response protein [Parasponia andersonii]|uniref:Dirigent protein n=1 Tax=Parasponia andersonii TaxID=3476 RepID=A0A2P5D640_PARAD|nr:Disease resistance response protein [Parasponia andersonii]